MSPQSRGCRYVDVDLRGLRVCDGWRFPCAPMATEKSDLIDERLLPTVEGLWLAKEHQLRLPPARRLRIGAACSSRTVIFPLVVPVRPCGVGARVRVERLQLKKSHRPSWCWGGRPF